MRVVTTCHQVGYDQYGHRFLETWPNWPKHCELLFYAEGFDIPETERVRVLDIRSDPGLLELRQQHLHYVPPTWRHDVVKFAHKVFAMEDACRDHEGIVIWADADVIAWRQIPNGYLESLLGDADLAYFGRDGFYTETGFWMVRAENSRRFFDRMHEIYLTGKFKQLSQWHDCMIFDAARKSSGIKSVNLSGEYSGDMHPIVKSDLGRYLDHLKGARKGLELSPENPWRDAT